MADEIIIKYTADTEALEKRLKKVEEQLGDVGDEAQEAGKKTNKAMKESEQSTKGLTMSMDKLAVAVAGAFAVQRIIEFSSQMRDLAVTVETTQKRVQVVFGESANQIEKDARRMANSLGLSNDQFKLMATQVGDVLVPLGLSRKEAGKMSSEAVKLAGALSEFSAGQVTMEQAVHAMVGAFTGEREALKSLGVVISEENVKERLLLKGQEDLEGQALASAKAFATFELILEKSADAQTFFEQNSNSLARQVAQSKAQLQTLREEVAKKLTPAITTITKRMVEFLSNLEVSDLIRFARIVGTIVSGILAYKVAVTSATAVTKLFNKTLNATPIGLVAGAVTSLVVALQTQNSEFEESVRQQEAYNEGLTKAEEKVRKVTEAQYAQIQALKDQRDEQLRLAQSEGKNELEMAKLRGASNREIVALIDKQIAKDAERWQKIKEAQFAVRAGIDKLEQAELKADKIVGTRKDQNRKEAIAWAKGRLKIIAQEQAKILGYEGEISDAYMLQGMLSQELISNREYENQLREERNEIINEEINNDAKSKALQNDSINSLEKRLKLLKERLMLETDITKQQQLADDIRVLQQQIDNRMILLGLKKSEAKTDKQIADEKEKKRKEEFQKEIDRINNVMFARKKDARQEMNDEKKLKIELFKIELEHMKNVLEAQKKFGLNTEEQELLIQEKIDGIRGAMADAMIMDMATTEDIIGGFVLSTVEGFKLMSEEGLKFALNMASALISVAKQMSDESLGLAVFEILLNKAIAISQIFAKSQTGEPLSTGVKVAMLIAQLVTGFAEINAIVNQAQSARDGNVQGFARGVIGLRGEGSGTGDMIHARLSAGESVITANRTRQYYDELSAIQSGTLDKLIKRKYIPSMLDNSPTITVDGGFTDRNLINQMRKQENLNNKRHKELVGALSQRTISRKSWY